MKYMLGRSMVRIPKQRNNTKPAGKTPNVRREQGDPERPARGPHEGHRAGPDPPHAQGVLGVPPSQTLRPVCAGGSRAWLRSARQNLDPSWGSWGKVFGTLSCPGGVSPSQEQGSSLAELRQSRHAAAAAQTQPKGLGPLSPRCRPGPSRSRRPPDAVVGPRWARTKPPRSGRGPGERQRPILPSPSAPGNLTACVRGTGQGYVSLNRRPRARREHGASPKARTPACPPQKATPRRTR